MGFFNQIGNYLTARTGVVVGLGLTALFLVLALILVPIFMTGGYKKGVYRAGVAVGCTAVSFVVAVVSAKLAATAIVNGAYGIIESQMPDLNGAPLPEHIVALIKGGISAVIGVVLFVLLFFVLLLVTKLAVGHISALKNGLSRENASVGFKCGGMLIGLVDALVIVFAFTAPVFTFMGIGAKTLGDVTECVEGAALEDVSEPSLERLQNVKEFCKPLRSNLLVRLANLPVLDFSASVFGNFTCNGEKYNCFDVLTDGVDIAVSASTIIVKPVAEYGENEVGAAKEIVEKCRKNRFFFCLVSDFAGSYLDSVDGDGLTGEMISSLAEAARCSTVDDYIECADSLVGLFELTVQQGILKNADDGDAVFDALTEPEFVENAVVCMRSAAMLSRTLDNFMLAATDFIVLDDGDETASVLADIKKDMAASISAGTNDIDAEVKSLQLIASGMKRILDSTEGAEQDSFINLDAKGVADLLIGLGLHPYIGRDNVDGLISVTLRSFNDTAGGIFSDEFIEKVLAAYRSDLEAFFANGEQGKFENLLVSARYLVNVVGNIGDGDASKDDTVDMVGELMEVMSSDTAETLTEVVADEFMSNLNIKGESLDKVSDFVSDILLNMVEVKENGGDIEKEKHGITEMASITLNASEKMKDKDTTIEDVVDGDLDGFLKKVTDSDVVMETVGNAVKKDGADPTGVFDGILSESDVNKITTACDSLVKESGGDSELAEKLAAICLFMGIEK